MNLKEMMFINLVTFRFHLKKDFKSKISNNSIKFLTHNDKTINEYKWFLIIN